MDRRGFLKRGAALAVAGAFPLPAVPAPIKFKGVAILFDCDAPMHMFDPMSWFCTRCGRAAQDVLDEQRWPRACN